VSPQKPIITDLLSKLEKYRGEWLQAIADMREMVLSNLAMVSQVPAETFHEDKRSALLADRYIASGVPEPSTDDLHNVTGTLHGRKPGRGILVFTHMDHQSDMRIDRNVTITQDTVLGRGVAEDTFALSVLISLPDIFSRLGITFQRDVVLLATTRSHGRGDLEGIRHFMDKHEGEIGVAINLVGIPLGTVDYFSQSRVRCDISCDIDMATPTGSDRAKLNDVSAILVINEVINQLETIPLPRSPKTLINIGMISGGQRYSTVSTQAKLGLEVLSEDDRQTERVMEEIHDRCMDVGAKYDVVVETDFFGRRHAAGLRYSHPLVKSAVSIIDFLGYRPIMAYNNSGLAIPLSRSIPAVTLGLSTGSFSASRRGHVDIAPIPDGILQLLMLLYAIDRGYCDG
jgi:acetylornithine deacetylase/succinyl-diaminopimelate desuccinylase-like protein